MAASHCVPSMCLLWDRQEIGKGVGVDTILRNHYDPFLYTIRKREGIRRFISSVAYDNGLVIIDEWL